MTASIDREGAFLISYDTFHGFSGIMFIHTKQQNAVLLRTETKQS